MLKLFVGHEETPVAAWQLASQLCPIFIAFLVFLSDFLPHSSHKIQNCDHGFHRPRLVCSKLRNWAKVDKDSGRVCDYLWLDVEVEIPMILEQVNLGPANQTEGIRPLWEARVLFSVMSGIWDMGHGLKARRDDLLQNLTEANPVDRRRFQLVKGMGHSCGFGVSTCLVPVMS